MSPDCTSAKLSLQSRPREAMDAFLLSSSLCNTISNFMHKSTCCWYRSLNEMRINEGAVPFIPYRALHSGRNALIGPISSSFLVNIYPPLIGRISSSSHPPDTLSFYHFILFYLFYFIYFIYLLNEDEKTLVARVAPNLPIVWPALCPPPILRVTNNYLC